MPWLPVGGVGTGGGGGLTLGPPTNTFTAATQALAEAARDAYATANASWLAEYDAEPTYTIEINWPVAVTDTLYQSRRSSAWADVTGLIRGKPGAAGAMGAQGRFLVYAYINAATAPTVAPTGGSYVRSTGTLTVPTGYTAVPSTPVTGSETYRTEAVVNPATDTDTVTLVWSVPAELPAYAIVSEAEDAAEEAAASAAAAAGSVALLESYSGPVLIVDADPFTSDDTDIVVLNWRDYDELAVTFLDSSGNAETYQCFVFVDSLEANGKAQIAVEQNAQIEITATDASDSLNFNFAGAVSGYPSTSDTISIWGLRVGVGAGGGGGGGGLTEAQVDARVAAGVLDPAETGNTTAWAVAKGGTGAVTAAAARTALAVLTQAEIDARARASLVTALTGTQTGITVTLQTDGSIDFVVSSMPVGDHSRRGAISTDVTLDQAEYDASTTTTDATLTMPTWSGGRRYLFIGIPEDEGDLTGISTGGIDIFNSWERVTGVILAHKWWRTTDDQSDVASGVTYQLSEA